MKWCRKLQGIEDMKFGVNIFSKELTENVVVKEEEQ